MTKRPHRFPEPPDLPPRPDVVPSNDVYVTQVVHPSGRHTARMRDFWSYRGVRLREILSDLHDIPESRIELQATIDEAAHYDFVLVPPRIEDADRMSALMQAGIEKHFDLRIEREMRRTDVFVMTAPNGITGLQPPELGGGLGAFTMDMTVPDGFDDLTEVQQRQFFEQHLRERIGGFAGGAAGGATPSGHVGASGDCSAGELGRMLEGMLGRFVVDETGSDGGFHLDINTEAGIDGFLEALQSRLGIVLTPDRRDVEMLVVKT